MIVCRTPQSVSVGFHSMATSLKTFPTSSFLRKLGPPRSYQRITPSSRCAVSTELVMGRASGGLQSRLVSTISWEETLTKELTKKQEEINLRLGRVSERDREMAEKVLKLLGGDFSGKRRKNHVSEAKKSLLVKHPEIQRHDMDCGSSEVQIANLTARIKTIEKHLKQSRKDNSTKRAYTAVCYRRQQLLRYLQRTRPDRYELLLKTITVPVQESLDSTKKVRVKKTKRIREAMERQKFLEMVRSTEGIDENEGKDKDKVE